MLAALVMAPAAGAVMDTVTDGCRMLKPRCALAVFPALSDAETVTECVPGAEMRPPDANGAPSATAVTEARFASLAEKTMVAGAVRTSPSVAPERLMEGCV